MCGIAGIVGCDGREIARAMVSTLSYRGPDAAGFYDSDEVSLAACRLRIIDLAGADQPVGNENGTIVTVFNGEIYNYRELRRFLEQKGHTFRTAGDTEVLVHLYEEFGDSMVHALRGMFAFAIWDGVRRRLLLARDRLGIKPLYVARSGDALLFGSELKAVVSSGLVRPEIDLDALDFYLSLQYVPGPGTMLRGVTKVEPGHLLTWEQGHARTTRYWDIVFGTDQPRRRWSAVVDEFRATLEDAVHTHEISDVPLGVLLSGGIDSSAVTALLGRDGAAPATFTVGFEGARRNGEAGNARLVARHLGTRHHEMMVRDDLLDRLPNIIWHLDEPVADPAAVATYFICEVASAHVKVVLSGEGGDELLGGYPRYWWIARSEQWGQWRPASMLASCAAAVWPNAWPATWRTRHIGTLLRGAPLERKHLAWICNFSDTAKQRLVAEPLHAAGSERLTGFVRSILDRCNAPDPASALMYLDFKTWLPDNILTKIDRMSMALSIEARVPYLDHRLVEFTASLPLATKLRGAGGKRLLREAMARELPRATIRRQKQAFRVPISDWLRTGLRDMTADALTGRQARERGLFHPAVVRQMIDEHASGRIDHGQSLWNLLSLELWLQAFIDGRPTGVAGSAAPLVADHATAGVRAGW